MLVKRTAGWADRLLGDNQFSRRVVSSRSKSKLARIYLCMLFVADSVAQPFFFFLLKTLCSLKHPDRGQSCYGYTALISCISSRAPRTWKRLAYPTRGVTVVVPMQNCVSVCTNNPFLRVATASSTRDRSVIRRIRPASRRRCGGCGVLSTVDDPAAPISFCS